ncbi:hypothetical protein RI054_19g87700 [Pseudoscourfieldia marina]
MVCGTKQACQYSGTHICVDVDATVRACKSHACDLLMIRLSLPLCSRCKSNTIMGRGMGGEEQSPGKERRQRRFVACCAPMSLANMLVSATLVTAGPAHDSLPFPLVPLVLPLIVRWNTV